MKMPLIILTLILLFQAQPASSTTIAWDGRYLVADSQVTEYTIDKDGKETQTRKIFNYLKIHYVRGYLVAGAGNTTDIDKFLRWLRDPSGKTPYPFKGHFSAVVISKAGTYIYVGNSLHPFKAEPPVVLGSGGEVAMEVMEFGGSALEGVKAAEVKDEHTGGPIMMVKVNQ
jgi:hypothetical protein